jgi:3-oxoadipate enol-lactonase
VCSRYRSRGKTSTSSAPTSSSSRTSSPEDAQRLIDAFFVRDDPSDRLRQLSAPTLVLAGGRDLTMRPEVCGEVADLIRGARFEVLEEEAHQPFQEVPD